MDEMTPEQMFNKMMEQQQKIIDNRGTSMGPLGQPSGSSIEEQRILSEVRSHAPSATAVPSQGECPQCKSFHPPLGPGEKCPNAEVKVKGIDEISINIFVVKVRDILVSQLEQKEVKDIDKFVGGMVLGLMKYCEEYKDWWSQAKNFWK